MKKSDFQRFCENIGARPLANATGVEYESCRLYIKNGTKPRLLARRLILAAFPQCPLP